MPAAMLRHSGTPRAATSKLLFSSLINTFIFERAATSKDDQPWCLNAVWVVIKYLCLVRYLVVCEGTKRPTSAAYTASDPIDTLSAPHLKYSLAMSSAEYLQEAKAPHLPQ
jgi:hypothetical protein